MQACDLAIEDSSERVVNLMVDLLEFFTKTNVVTVDQFERVSIYTWCSDYILVFFCILYKNMTPKLFYRASSALAVYAMVVCLCVCLSVRVSVRHKSEFY